MSEGAYGRMSGIWWWTAPRKEGCSCSPWPPDEREMNTHMSVFFFFRKHCGAGRLKKQCGPKDKRIDTDQVHVVVMAPWHEHVVEATALGVDPKLGVELGVVVVRVLLEVLQQWIQNSFGFRIQRPSGPQGGSETEQSTTALDCDFSASSQSHAESLHDCC